MKATATYERQKGVPYVMNKGYIPADKIHEATSIAMEYAVDDWGIAAMAYKMGQKKMQQHMHSALRIIRTTLINQSDLYALSLKTVHGELLMTLQSPSIR